MHNQNKIEKNRILLVSSDPSMGMIHFAASIINELVKIKELDTYFLLTTKGNNSYQDILSEEALKRSTFIEYPQNKLVNAFYKLIPIDISLAIKKITHKNTIKKIHFITGDFRMWSFIKLFPSYEYYYTVHDLSPHERTCQNNRQKILFKYINWSYQFNTKHINNLITCSNEQYNNLKKIYPNKNVYLSHFPSLVNNKIKNGIEKVKELEGINNYILFFGGVDYYKGVDILIEAYKQIQTSQPLVIAGKGIQFKGHNIITVNRVIKDEELKDLFDKASIVVYPYRSITMSGVLSIAYYFKKNTIVSDLAFFLQNKSQNTFVFKRNDIQSLATTLGKALNNPVNMANAYDEVYSNKQSSQEYLNFYNPIYQ